MSVGRGAWGERVVAVCCLVLALQVGYAQKRPVVSPSAARTILVENAQALEARGRPDLAIQVWKQVLLSDPNNAVALAGLARDLRLIGSLEQSNAALDRLRRVNPSNPEIARIEALSGTSTESDLLRRAGKLAAEGRVEDAMRIYRQLFGDHPPGGTIGMAYYQTLFGTPNGKQEAIAGMRALAQQNPGDPRFAIALGIMLTYNAQTRDEGMRILRAHLNDPTARAGLRQAIIWNGANPNTLPELRAYLREHPNDAEVAGLIQQDERKMAQIGYGIARTPAEVAAYTALNDHRTAEAEQRFDALLAKEPNNGRVVAGLGFLRMQQKNFGEAIRYLTLAEQDGFRAAVVRRALATSRLWYIMNEALAAFNANELNLAAIDYRDALSIDPRRPEALTGLAGVLTKQGQYAAAAGVYERLVRVQPGNVQAWRGLFLSYAQQGDNQRALAAAGRFPPGVRYALERDPEYLRTLALVYQAEGRNRDAQRVLARALTLPFPGNGSSLEEDTKLQYAGILMAAEDYNRAAALYGQIVAADPNNLSAWMGMVSARHSLGEDEQALNDVKNMPADTYDAALANTGFLSTLAAMYQSAHQYAVAQAFLERAEKLETAAGTQPSVALQLQMASIYLLRNESATAFAIYRRVLEANPGRASAWKGLITALQASNRDTQAIEEIARMPAPVRQKLESDISFVQTEASLYAATGDTARALEYMQRVNAFYAKHRELPPPAIAIQNAWLLYNTGSDRALYSDLMQLGGRSDLTVAQREQVQNIWADWSVRRAGVAMDNGNYRRAVEILDAASQAFPNNLTVRKAVAGGYAQVGRAKEALALYKTIPMQNATSGDFQGAVGAALAANDKTQAEIWLRQALQRYPRDPAILALAARYEMARGDNARAADYYRASLAAMPAASPVDRLAHVLVYPEEDLRPHRAVTAADLYRLLNPDNQPFPKTTKLPPLPAYGPDPYNGLAPVVLPQPKTAAQQPQYTPASGSGPVSEIHWPSVHGAEQAAAAVSRNQLRVAELGRRGVPLPVSSGGAGAGLLGAGSMAQAGTDMPPASAQTASGQPVELSLHPPHSLASDAWKGLVFSLMAGNHYRQALDQLNKIPPDIRSQLDADVGFVQGIASLYMEVGDTGRAAEYMNEVENFHLLHRTEMPAGLEIQYAWLLYNMHNATGLYPVMMRLDQRTDLTAADRAQVNNIWASWAVRRAAEAMDNGNIVHGVELLQAAYEDYPNNLAVRRAIAGAYARVGRATDALALYKTIPMTGASAGDYQGAIAAAMTAGDMAQAEAWLRDALARYSNDPGILEQAARFEQARGDNARASDFWRAALAALPPGSPLENLETGLDLPPSAFASPEPGDTKRLLNPQLYPLPAPSGGLPTLPAYPQPAPISQAAPPAAATQPAATEQTPQYEPPSNNPLPLPPAANPQAAPSEQETPPAGTAPAPAPPSNPPPIYYVPQSMNNPPPAGTANGGAQLSRYMGQMHMPPSGEYGDADGPESADSAQESLQQPANAASAMPSNGTPMEGVQTASQPMSAEAAEVETLFAGQTDSQITQGSEAVIHTIPNAQVGLPSVSGAAPPGQVQYTLAQNTPSAQQVTTGAYSAPTQQTTPPAQQPSTPPAKPSPSAHLLRRRRTGRRMEQRYQRHTLGNAPIVAPALPPEAVYPQPAAPPPQAYPSYSAAPYAPGGTGLTNQQLEQQNLPPLTGPYVRIQRQAPPLNPREIAEEQLAAIESGYSGWLGGTALLNYRSGTLGYAHLAAFESPFEASAPLGSAARIVAVAEPVFLDSGQADGTATMSVDECTTAGCSLTAIPEPIGTLTDPNVSPPAQQNAFGLGGELQLIFPHLALAGGYTPAGFLVSTFIARGMWNPGNGPLTFFFNRDSQRDSQLSYAGLRDPAGNTLATKGQIWGGVIDNQGSVQYSRASAESGFYLIAGGEYLTGYEVESNTQVNGTGGGYWRALTLPEYGNLSIGANFFAMHYAHNENAFTHGMGGYFSPQGYILANIPFTWAGHYGTKWHYNIMSAIGVQAFEQGQTPLWPLAADKPLESSQNNPQIPALTDVSANYDLNSEYAYQITPHWFAGGYLGANNTRNYSFASVGFFLRYMFRAQPSTATAPTGLFPSDGLRPFAVP